MQIVKTNYNIATFILFIVEIFAFKSKQLTASSFKLIRFVICKNNAESFGIKDIKLRRRKDTFYSTNLSKLFAAFVLAHFPFSKLLCIFISLGIVTN